MSTPDFETIRWGLEALLAALAGVLWYLVKQLIKDVRVLGSALSDYKLHVAENYVTQNGLTKALDGLTSQIEAVFRKLDRIDEKLDAKADK